MTKPELDEDALAAAVISTIFNHAEGPESALRVLKAVMESAYSILVGGDSDCCPCDDCVERRKGGMH